MAQAADLKHGESPSPPIAPAPPGGEKAKEKPKERSWFDWIAVSTATLAVITAFASAESGKAANATLRLTNLETDQWSYYQAKSIKEHSYGLQAELLTLLPRAPELDGIRAEARGRYQAERSRYEKEKKDIEARAQKLAEERRVASERQGRFAKALIALQIAIVLSSVAGLTKKKWLYLSGLGLGVIGIALFAWGIVVA